MKKRMPTEEEIRKGFVGYSAGGTHYKAFVSVIGRKYYIGYFELQHEIRPIPERGFCHFLKPGKFSVLREIRDFKEALRDVVSYGLDAKEMEGFRQGESDVLSYPG